MEGRVAVLGATGYVGQAIVRAMLAAGRPVTMLARRPPASIPQGACFLACDARDPTALKLALRNFDQIVNAVAGSPTTIVAVARNLAALWHAPGAAKTPILLHISTLAVFGQTSGILHEGSSPVPAIGHRYAMAKLEAEHILLSDRYAASACVILRPGCVYGPGAPVWTDRIGRLLLAKRLGYLGREGRGWCHLIQVNDLAKAAVKTLASPQPMIGIHHMLTPSELTWNAFFRCFGTHLGMQSVPKICRIKLAAEVWVNAPVAKLCGSAIPSFADVITPSMRRLFRSRAAFVARRRPILNTDAYCPLDTGLAEAASPLLSNAINSANLYPVAALAWASST